MGNGRESGWGWGSGNISYTLFINTVLSVLKKNSFSSNILTEPQEGQLLVTPLNIRSSTLIYPFLMHQSLLSGMQVLFPLGQGGGGNLALQGRGEVENLQTRQGSPYRQVPKGPISPSRKVTFLRIYRALSTMLGS